MPKRSSTEKDFAELAFDIVDKATNGGLTKIKKRPVKAASRSKAKQHNPYAKILAKAPTSQASTNPVKNPAAVALGSLGGKKGGPARAKALSKAKRSAIAKKAANERWKVKRRDT